ncbi:helix-turn-helix transcriptional regulator [Oerskovia sp. NPDC057915]|uniref:helix-turn-helix transcriptional regulator n=1 Tax=Oerskovia sp. NPDC057915 TaxID=3346280 RepID=UPI0036D8FA9D
MSAPTQAAVPRVAPDDGDSRRRSLALFLRARRESLQPEDVGLPPSRRRRTPGLRREEVAVLANVGVTWYTWLEQGREIGVSAVVVESIARALRLVDGDLAYLYELTGTRLPSRSSAPTELRDNLVRVLDGFSELPAYVVDRYWNVVATNELAEHVFGSQVGANCLADFFTEERVAERYPQRALVGRMIVGQLRRQAAAYPSDRTFDLLADRVSAASPEFAAYWTSYSVGVEPHVDITYDHPQIGRLTWQCTVLNPLGGEDLRLFLYLPRPGTGTAEALQRLR